MHTSSVIRVLYIVSRVQITRGQTVHALFLVRNIFGTVVGIERHDDAMLVAGTLRSQALVCPYARPYSSNTAGHVQVLY